MVEAVAASAGGHPSPAKRSAPTPSLRSASPGNDEPDAKRHKTLDELAYEELAREPPQATAQEGEVTIAPNLHLPLNKDVLKTFFQYAHERHQIFLRRKQGLPQDEWTTDPVLQSTKFANIFRVLDRYTQYVLTEVIGKGPQTLEETVFRVILFRSFARISTYEVIRKALQGEPTYANFSPAAYENILFPHIGAGNAIYGSSYFIPAPKEFKTRYPFQSTLRLISLMMRAGLPQKLAELRHMRDAHSMLILYPSLGNFLAMQMLLDLNLTPYIDLSEEEFAACGPGSRQCLVDIFGRYVQGFELEAMRWIQREQHTYWREFGIEEVPHLCPSRQPGLNMVDIEHTLCEVFKYRRALGRLSEAAKRKPGQRGRPPGSVSRARSQTAGAQIKSEEDDGADGLDFSRIRSDGSEVPSSVNARSFAPTADGIGSALPDKWLVPFKSEDYDRPAPEQRDGEEIYEVSHIVTMNASQTKCLVRWKGFGPDDDTWERYEELVEGANEAVQAYLDWPKKVKETVETIVKEEKEEEDRLQHMSAESLLSSSSNTSQRWPLLSASQGPGSLDTHAVASSTNLPLGIGLPF